MISSCSVAGVRTLYLQVLSLSYTVALHSLYVQLPGLYSDTGVTPARGVMQKLRSEIMTHAMTHAMTRLLSNS